MEAAGGGGTDTQRFEGLAWDHLGLGRDRGGPEPKAVWPWPLKCQFSVGIPSALLSPALSPHPLCGHEGLMWGQLRPEEACRPPFSPSSIWVWLASPSVPEPFLPWATPSYIQSPPTPIPTLSG